MKDRVSELYKDSDGWWVILARPWVIDGCVGCREDTRSKLLSRSKTKSSTTGG